MRITQIMLSKGFGGGERYFVDLARALADRGHEVQALVHEKFGSVSMLDNHARLRLDKVNSLGMWDRWSVKRMIGAVRNFGPHVMHTHMARGAWAGSKAVTELETPLIATTHNYVDLKYYPGVSRFIPTTRDQERYLLEQGVGLDVIDRIPNFSMLPPAAAVSELTPGACRFVSFGRFVQKKGFACLLDAFARARKGGLEGATLSIGGDGPLLGALKRRTAELGLEQAVRFDGWIDDVAAYLGEGEVFVLPSLDEPFGIVMLEAMAAGRPIVSTRTQGPSEVLSDATAYFADVGDPESLAAALLAVASDSALAKRKARCALETYRRLYHCDAVVPRIERTYIAAVERARSS